MKIRHGLLNNKSGADYADFTVFVNQK